MGKAYEPSRVEELYSAFKDFEQSGILEKLKIVSEIEKQLHKIVYHGSFYSRIDDNHRLYIGDMEARFESFSEDDLEWSLATNITPSSPIFKSPDAPVWDDIIPYLTPEALENTTRDALEQIAELGDFCKTKLKELDGIDKQKAKNKGHDGYEK